MLCWIDFWLVRFDFGQGRFQCRNLLAHNPFGIYFLIACTSEYIFTKHGTTIKTYIHSKLKIDITVGDSKRFRFFFKKVSLLYADPVDFKSKNVVKVAEWKYPSGVIYCVRVFHFVPFSFCSMHSNINEKNCWLKDHNGLILEFILA